MSFQNPKGDAEMAEFIARHRKSIEIPSSHPSHQPKSFQIGTENDFVTTAPGIISDSVENNGYRIGENDDDNSPGVIRSSNMTGMSRSNSNNTQEDIEQMNSLELPSSTHIDQFDYDDHNYSNSDRTSSFLNQTPDYRQNKKVVNVRWIRHSLISGIFMLLWYLFSLSISVYNKWMFSKEHLNFQFPILTTSGHQFIQFILSLLVLKVAGKPYHKFIKITSDPPGQNSNNLTDEDEEAEYTLEQGDNSLNNNSNRINVTSRRGRLRGSSISSSSLVSSRRRTGGSDDEDDEDLIEDSSTLRRPVIEDEDSPNSDGEDDKDESDLLNQQNHRRDENDKKLQPNSWLRSYVRGIVPTATASGADIGLGNASLRVVSLSFYTMVKSSSLGFVLLFGILFKLEVATCQIFSIIGVMSVGVIMMVAGETEFSLLGFFLVLGAALFSGLRWSLTQLLLRSDAHLSKVSTHNDPVRTIMYISPPMGIFLFLWGCLFEGLPSFIAAPLWKEKGAFAGVIIMMIPGVIAFLMTLSEFFLLNGTSVLTLSIAGIFKELLTLLVAALYFGDEMSIVNGIGLIITLCAIISYNVYRFKRFQSGPGR